MSANSHVTTPKDIRQSALEGVAEPGALNACPPRPLCSNVRFQKCRSFKVCGAYARMSLASPRAWRRVCVEVSNHAQVSRRSPGRARTILLAVEHAPPEAPPHDDWRHVGRAGHRGWHV